MAGQAMSRHRDVGDVSDRRVERTSNTWRARPVSRARRRANGSRRTNVGQPRDGEVGNTERAMRSGSAPTAKAGAMKPFPTIWYRGDEAGFYVDYKLVRVPVRFFVRNNDGTGEDDSDRFSLHVIPWIHRYQPLSIKNGRLYGKETVDGVVTDIDLGREFAKAKHRGIGYEFDRITTVDGNYLNWTGNNIRPKRDPNKIATAGERESEAQRWMRVHETEVSGPTDDPHTTLQNFQRDIAAAIKRDRTEFLHAVDDLLTTEQSIEVNTLAMTLLTTWERKLAERFTVGDAETVNKQRKEDQLLDDAESLFSADEQPASSAYKSPDLKSNGKPVTRVPALFESEEEKAAIKRGDGKASPLETPPSLKQIQTSACARYQTFALVAAHDLAFPHAGTERVLNAFGWVTPENGHRPTYEGRDHRQVWLRTLPVVFPPRTIHVAQVPTAPKCYVPSEPLPVRAVPVGEVPSRPIKICTCAICLAPHEPPKLTLMTVIDDYGTPITLQLKKAQRYLKDKKASVR